MLKVWIAGASGQIGRALNDVLDPMQIEALNTDLDELDITDTDEVINFGTVNRPDVIINCTGITDTDECEANPEHAYRVNALGARNLSIVARKCGFKIVQLSTDDVFDGQSKKPYTEFDDTNPRQYMADPKEPEKTMSKNLRTSILLSEVTGCTDMVDTTL